VKAGVNAVFSKYDLVDAYKNVPVKLYNIRLQGFSWLSKFFVETRQIFGAKTAVPNYAIFGNTLLTLANAKTKIPKRYLHKALDDVPVISPLCKDWCLTFHNAYTNLCKSLNVKLAEPCPKNEKAFVNAKFGKVLGFFFDSSLMAWKLPDDKRKKYLNIAIDMLENGSSDLLQMQTLMGCLNHAGMFAPFLRGMKFNLNKTLGFLQTTTKKLVCLPEPCKFELRVWANFLADTDWHPLGGLHYSPPLFCKSFSSDAAGCQSPNFCNEKVGCGNIGFDEDGKILFANQFFWPSSFVNSATDKFEKRLGSKTTTLEFIGLIVPFLLMPEKLMRQYIIVNVDNSGCFFGWINRHVAGDEMASIFVRALHLIACYLECDIHVSHMPRLSTWEASVVDRLSREKTTTAQDRKLLNSFHNRDLPQCLVKWMENPTEDWNLSLSLLEHVKRLIKNDS
jgi:hypothetical protein